MGIFLVFMFELSWYRGLFQEQTMPSGTFISSRKTFEESELLL